MGGAQAQARDRRRVPARQGFSLRPHARDALTRLHRLQRVGGGISPPPFPAAPNGLFPGASRVFTDIAGTAAPIGSAWETRLPPTLSRATVMNVRHFAIAAAICAIVQPALAQKTVRDDMSIQVTPGEAHYKSRTHAEGTVIAINYATRSISLRLDDGEEVTMTARPEIKRLNMIKIGDKVVADYEERLHARVIKGGRQPIGWQSTNSAQSAASGPPAGSMTANAILIANITNVDRQASVVTFQGALESKELIVQDPKQLALMEIGDQLEVTVTGMLALSVEPAAPKIK
ncbi:hypothetical protein KRR38_14395 [Novosphingobium sp. G106]|uniref:hypothetical protein n=1 Tax=Novosphingobium sp. G106 TaxID=2849500 RepID=UPI001C2D7552|nr:hypothetical protein [Novosphingobium sp. G106]MBV1688829.1 hypothetical protein [Novosphingobium sp. G106]